MPTNQSQSRSRTHVGRVRSSNEDAYLARDDLGLWAVADGMGGHEGGELASRLTIASLESVQSVDSFDRLFQETRSALEKANSELIGMADQFSRGRAAGSTVAVLLLRADRGFVLWAGDSRVYRLRDDILEQLTRDHSHLQALIDDDMITEEEAEFHPLAHLITRAVGFSEPLGLQVMEMEVRPRDRFLLCSDGLNRVVPRSEIENMMKIENLEEAVDAMLNTTLDQGAPDNVTMIAVDHHL